MEGPIEFDILGYVDPEKKSEAIKLFQAIYGDKNFVARKSLLDALKNNQKVKVAEYLGWNEVIKFLESPPVGFVNLAIVEATYYTIEKMEYCEKHQLYFTSVGECPVCTGWYVNTDEDGYKVVATAL